MDTGVVLPLCSEVVADDCFDLADQKHVKRDGLHVYKNATAVLEWN
jgi:hypothetical protein